MQCLYAASKWCMVCCARCAHSQNANKWLNCFITRLLATLLRRDLNANVVFLLLFFFSSSFFRFFVCLYYFVIFSSLHLFFLSISRFLDIIIPKIFSDIFIYILFLCLFSHFSVVFFFFWLMWCIRKTRNTHYRSKQQQNKKLRYNWHNWIELAPFNQT